MANNSNLKSFKTVEEAREKGRIGGIKSGQAKREKKLFKEAIEKQLGKNIDDMVKAMISQALNGNVKAMAFLRDTIGEKPVDKIESDVSVSYEETLKKLSGKNEY